MISALIHVGHSGPSLSAIGLCNVCAWSRQVTKHSALVVLVLRLSAIWVTANGAQVPQVRTQQSAPSTRPTDRDLEKPNPAANEYPADKAASPDPLLAPARALLAKGSLPEAESATRRFLQNHAESAEGHYLLGFILFREISAKWFETGKAHGQTSPYYGADASGAVAQFRDAKAKESLAEFTTGAKFRVPSAFDLKIVALDYVLLKAYVDADQWLTQSLRRNPRDAQAWYYLGRTKYSESQFPEAIQAFVECLKLEPHNVEAETNVGLSYEALAQRDQARQAFENAIAWEADAAAKDPQPYIELGHLYLQQNEAEKAVPYLVQVNSIAPNVSKAHEELGRAYSLLHRLPESQAELEKAAALDPETAQLHCLLGQVYRQQGMVAQAQSEFDRCTALQQTQPAAAVKK